MSIAKYAGFAAVALTALYVLGFLRLPIPHVAPPPGTFVASDPDQHGAAKNPIEVVTIESIRLQRRAAAKLAQGQYLQASENASKAIKEWEEELAGWEAEGPPLLKNADGKKIAGDTSQASRFRGLIRAARPTRDELEADRKLLGEITSLIRAARENINDASTPDNSLSNGVETIEIKAKSARDAYREARAGARGMLARVKSAPPAEKTLEEAIATIDEKEADERAAARAEIEKKVKDEAEELIAKKNEQLVKEEADHKAALIANKVELKRQETELARNLTIAEMRAKQKEMGDRITAIEAEAERKRQGDLKAGSVWKGRHAYSGSPGGEATLTITTRSKDEIQGTMTIVEGGKETVTVQGKLVGTKLKLMVNGGLAYDAVYDAAARTISGTHLTVVGTTWGTFSLRLSDEKEE